MNLPDKIFAVEFGGFWEFASGESYDSIPFLDTDKYADAEYFANECVKRYNNYEKFRHTIKDLLCIVDYYHDKEIQYTESPYKNWNSIINNARKISNETSTNI